jgi:hypothetical protein
MLKISRISLLILLVASGAAAQDAPFINATVQPGSYALSHSVLLGTYDTPAKCRKAGGLWDTVVKGCRMQGEQDTITVQEGAGGNYTVTIVTLGNEGASCTFMGQGRKVSESRIEAKGHLFEAEEAIPGTDKCVAYVDFSIQSGTASSWLDTVASVTHNGQCPCPAYNTALLIERASMVPADH